MQFVHDVHAGVSKEAHRVRKEAHPRSSLHVYERLLNGARGELIAARAGRIANRINLSERVQCLNSATQNTAMAKL